MGLIDLHVHSNASDGTLSPAQVVNLAAAQGLAAIALTDHDTIDGVRQARQAAKAAGGSPKVVPGIELSCVYRGKEIHILGLYISIDDPAFIRRLREFRSQRDARNREMLRRFAADGIVLSQEELTGGNPGTVITRAHVAKALAARGLVSDTGQAFKSYLVYGGRYCPPKEHITPEMVMEALNQNGAFAALAHPYQYKLGDKGTQELAAYLTGLGMKGLEVYHSSNNQHESGKLKDLARSLGLLPTGGSDFHGDLKPDISIGRGRGKLAVSSLLLDDIERSMGL